MMTAVPPGALHHDVAAKVVHLDANAEELKAAPRFDPANWTESTDAEHISEIIATVGQESAFKDTGGETDQAKADGPTHGSVAASPSSMDRKPSSDCNGLTPRPSTRLSKADHWQHRVTRIAIHFQAQLKYKLYENTKRSVSG